MGLTRLFWIEYAAVDSYTNNYVNVYDKNTCICCVSSHTVVKIRCVSSSTTELKSAFVVSYSYSWK